MMSQKPEENTHNALFDGTEIKLLISSNKSWIHEGFFESTRW